MQTAPRIVVIDDKKDHLTAIVETFNQLGTSCFAIEYDAVTGVPVDHLRGVRVLFLDVHLLSGEQSSDPQKNYGPLAEILQNGIRDDGGPYVLILWTENPDELVPFQTFLEERLFPEFPHTRPLSFVALNKADYFSVSNATPEAGAKLLAAVREKTEGNPQLNALLAWERDVMAAAGSTLSTILALVDADKRTVEAGSEPLDKILSLLAREQVGKGNVSTDVRSAITAVLAPILADRIMNRNPAEGDEDRWRAAVTCHKAADLTLSALQAASINRMLHLSAGTTEQLLPTDWGSVVEYPKDELDGTSFKRRFGVTHKQMIGQEFLIEKDSRSKVKVVLVRTGAACDHAQSNTGPLPYLFGIIRPLDAGRIKEGEEERKLKASVWISPRLQNHHVEGPFVIEVNARFPFVMNYEDGSALNVLFRLREQLLVQLLNHAGSYSVRPGIVCL